MEEMNLKLPELSAVDDIVIWEGQTQSPTPKLASKSQSEREWIMSSETIFYQRFAY